MTEAEWLEAGTPSRMLGLLLKVASDRKLRLFAVACGRVMVAGTDAPSAAAAIEVSERFADGGASEVELRAARKAVSLDWGRVHSAGEVNASFARNIAFGTAYQASRPSSQKVVEEVGMLLNRDVGGVPKAHQGELLHCIFGNPFRPVAFSPSWLTPTAVGIARGIYDDRALDRLPILADALQDAGCEDEQVLGHCRGGGVHVRGCWVVDGILGLG